MMEKKKANLLLFGRECAAKGLLWYLYFADANSLSSRSPRIRRFVCLRCKEVEAAPLGKVYDVTHTNFRLRTLAEAGEMALTEADYQRLLRLRDLRCRRLAGPRLCDTQDLEHSYYTWDEMRQIAGWSVLPRERARCAALRNVLGFLSFALPVVLLMLSLWLFVSSVVAVKFARPEYFYLLPLFYFVSVPLMVFGMYLFRAFSEAAVFGRNSLRAALLQKHIHLTGGERLQTGLSLAHKEELRRWGLISGGVYALFWLLALIL